MPDRYVDSRKKSIAGSAKRKYNLREYNKLLFCFGSIPVPG